MNLVLFGFFVVLNQNNLWHERYLVDTTLGVRGPIVSLWQSQTTTVVAMSPLCQRLVNPTCDSAAVPCCCVWIRAVPYVIHIHIYIYIYVCACNSTLFHMYVCERLCVCGSVRLRAVPYHMSGPCSPKNRSRILLSESAWPSQVFGACSTMA